MEALTHRLCDPQCTIAALSGGQIEFHGGQSTGLVFGIIDKGAETPASQISPAPKGHWILHATNHMRDF